MGGGQNAEFVLHYMDLIVEDGAEPPKWYIRLGHYLYWRLTSNPPSRKQRRNSPQGDNNDVSKVNERLEGSTSIGSVGT